MVQVWSVAHHLWDQRWVAWVITERSLWANYPLWQMRPVRLREAGPTQRTVLPDPRGATEGRAGSQTGLGLTTAGGPQGDFAGQGDLCKGGYFAGVELAGLPDQALGCVWEHEAFDGLFWKDLDGVFTCGLKAEKDSRGHQLW